MEDYSDALYQSSTEEYTPDEVLDELTATAEFIQRRFEAGTYKTIPPEARTLLNLSPEDKVVWLHTIGRLGLSTDWMIKYADRMLEKSS
jgi:hypothetical protein